MRASDTPRVPRMKYEARFGTRWQRELQAAGGLGAFEYPDDPKLIGPWIIGECVGKGANGRVKIAKHKRTGQLAAVKILPLQPLVNSRASLATQRAKSDKQRLGIDREITMMKLMDHPNIMRIYDVYEGDKELYLVLEYVEGGELFDLLVNRGRLHPLEALTYFKQLVYGLNYAHTFSIIHRDLKPENILIHSLNPPLIKIADWGMAAFAPPALQLETSCGSPHYASPEIVNGEKYEGNATDIWSCGVILFALLTGRLPFEDENVKHLLAKVKTGKYDIPPYVDPQARDLLSRMLIVDVTKRMTIPEILAHPWLSFKTPGLTPTLPPPPSRLARPLRSLAHIDPDLLESLRVIWGKHADVSIIKKALLSPPGKGTLAKAFYFLLERYRERVECEDGYGEESSERENAFEWILLGGKAHTVTKQYTKPKTSLAAYSYPPKKTQVNVPKSSRVSPAPPLYPYSRHGPMVQRGANAVRQQQYMQVQPQPHRPLTLAPPTLNDPSSGCRSRPPSPLGPRPTRARPSSYYGSRRPPTPSHNVPSAQGQTQTYTNVHMCGERMMTTDSPMELNVSSVLFPVQREPEHEHEKSPGGPRTQAGMIYAPVPVHLQPMPMLTAPQTENVELQRTINDITDRMNVLMESQNRGEAKYESGVQGEVGWFDGPHGYVSVEVASDRGRVRVEEDASREKERDRNRDGDKENRYRGEDERRSGYKNGGVAFKQTARPGNLGDTVFENKGLKEEGKMRPPTLELHNSAVNPKRSTLSMLASPTLTPRSPPALFSPVVGEFKGWFSNLFNWKHAHQCVLYSKEELSTTRAETVRLLEQFGVIVALEEGLLRCRAEESAPGDAGAVQKRAWFKVEFTATGWSGQMHTPRLPHGYSPYLSAHQSPIPGLTSPNPNGQGGGSGGARANTVQVMHVPGSVCAIVLVQEKGSVSGFRSVCGRLKEEWRVGEAGLMSPALEHVQRGV